MQSTDCQTPGAKYHTEIHDEQLTVRVEFGKNLRLNKAEGFLLEANLHNAIELVLARYFEPELEPDYEEDYT